MNLLIHDILRNLFQFVEDWSFFIGDYKKMKDYYIPDFERKSFKNEDQDRLKPLYYLSKKTSYKNPFKES